MSDPKRQFCSEMRNAFTAGSLPMNGKNENICHNLKAKSCCDTRNTETAETCKRWGQMGHGARNRCKEATAVCAQSRAWKSQILRSLRRMCDNSVATQTSVGRSVTQADFSRARGSTPRNLEARANLPLTKRLFGCCSAHPSQVFGCGICKRR